MKYNNNIKRLLYINKNKDKDNNISKIKTRSNSKKVLKKNGSTNKSILKIPKNIPEHINTSKYISIKGKNNPNLNRYNSLKQINDKNKININTNKENEQFNKTFSKLTNIENMSTNTRSSTNHDNKNAKVVVKSFVKNKNSNPTIINGRTPIPIKKSLSKAQSFNK